MASSKPLRTLALASVKPVVSGAALAASGAALATIATSVTTPRQLKVGVDDDAETVVERVLVAAKLSVVMDSIAVDMLGAIFEIGGVKSGVKSGGGVKSIVEQCQNSHVFRNVSLVAQVVAEAKIDYEQQRGGGAGAGAGDFVHFVNDFHSTNNITFGEDGEGNDIGAIDFFNMIIDGKEFCQSFCQFINTKDLYLYEKYHQLLKEEWYQSEEGEEKQQEKQQEVVKKEVVEEEVVEEEEEQQEDEGYESGEEEEVEQQGSTSYMRVAMWVVLLMLVVFLLFTFVSRIENKQALYQALYQALFKLFKQALSLYYVM